MGKARDLWRGSNRESHGKRGGMTKAKHGRSEERMETDAGDADVHHVEKLDHMLALSDSTHKRWS